MKNEALNRFLAELTSFAADVKPTAPAGLDWEELVEILRLHELGQIASYQLDYRFLTRLAPPAEAREQLASMFNAAVNDNVLKITHLRRLLSEDGMPEAVLLGPSSWIDGLYPHVAFRYIDQVDLWVEGTTLGAAQGAFAEGGLKPSAAGGPTIARSVAARLASPDIQLSLWRAPPGLAVHGVSEMWARKGPMRAYGPAAHRLDPADAVLSHVAALALEGFAVPRIRLVDLREMVLRVDAEGGFYGPKSPPLAGSAILERAKTFGLTRALWAGLRIVEALFPEAAAASAKLSSALPTRAKRLLEEAVVRPALDPRRRGVLRPVTLVRRQLLS